MKFGTAKEIITPTFPTRIACYSDFTSDFSAIHDDVFVRCLVIDDGNEKVVIMRPLGNVHLVDNESYRKIK